MTTQRTAELQTVLEGVDLPARKRDLLAYAREHDSSFVGELSTLPDREYRSLDEVGDALARVQPTPTSDTPMPREESDLPPGGAEYLNAHPQPGTVRNDAPPDNPPQKAIETASKLQKQQQERQKQLG
jgi:hypothetical protein